MVFNDILNIWEPQLSFRKHTVISYIACIGESDITIHVQSVEIRQKVTISWLISSMKRECHI